MDYNMIQGVYKDAYRLSGIYDQCYILDPRGMGIPVVKDDPTLSVSHAIEESVRDVYLLPPGD